MKRIEYYSAAWCGPCKMLKPTIEELIKDGYNIEVIDVDENNWASTNKQIYSVPTLVMYDEGFEVGRASGIPSKSELKEWLDD